MQLGNGPLSVNVSTSTGRLLSLTGQAGLLSAELSSEVRSTPLHLKRASYIRRKKE